MRRIVEYPEAEGKTITQLTITNTEEFHAIEIAFTDKTALQLELSTSMGITPTLIDWKSGDGEPIKKFPAVKVAA